MLHIAGFARSSAAAVVLIGTRLPIVFRVDFPDVSLLLYGLSVESDSVEVLIKLSGVVCTVSCSAREGAFCAGECVLSVSCEADSEEHVLCASRYLQGAHS